MQELLEELPFTGEKDDPLFIRASREVQGLSHDRLLIVYRDALAHVRHAAAIRKEFWKHLKDDDRIAIGDPKTCFYNLVLSRGPDPLTISGKTAEKVHYLLVTAWSAPISNAMNYFFNAMIGELRAS